jgi:hypothetical protein
MAPKPQVELSQVKAQRDGISPQWRIIWALKNRAQHPLRITSVRFPHQQFKSMKRIFEPPIDLNEDAETEFAQLIQCEERPGLVTENAFAIFYVRWLGAPWRLFVRLKVVVSVDGNPQATTEMITVQKAGFSGVET